jgi:hypothetical protein
VSACVFFIVFFGVDFVLLRGSCFYLVPMECQEKKSAREQETRRDRGEGDKDIGPLDPSLLSSPSEGHSRRVFGL